MEELKNDTTKGKNIINKNKKNVISNFTIIVFKTSTLYYALKIRKKKWFLL